MLFVIHHYDLILEPIIDRILKNVKYKIMSISKSILMSLFLDYGMDCLENLSLMVGFGIEGELTSIVSK